MAHEKKSAPPQPGKTAERPPAPGTTKYSEPTDAQRLRELLLRANLSQRAGARELGVDERTVRYWCAGETTPPRMAFLALERLIDLNRQTGGSETPVIRDGTA